MATIGVSMTSLHAFQARFAAAIYGEPAGAMGAADERGLPLEKRMDVYRNNVFASLVDALASAFPVVEKLVGSDFFRAMAREFLRDHMPRSRTLIGFGEELPDFLAQFPPVGTLPYLADVARLELAWLRAYHAPNVAALGPADFSALPEDRVADLFLTLHPSVQFLSSAYPIWSIWQSHQRGYEGQKITHVSEAVLILRPDLVVEIHQTDDAVLRFVNVLAQGRALGEAVEAGTEAGNGGFDLPHVLSLFLRGGGFSSLRLPDKRN